MALSPGRERQNCGGFQDSWAGLGALLGGVGGTPRTHNSHPISDLVTRTLNSLAGKADHQGFHLGHGRVGELLFPPVYFPRVWVFARTCLMVVNKNTIKFQVTECTLA